MEQRPLRLGDIVDDYCPRERRVTNHAIVAIVDNTVRQTRCSTCDAEHVYKQGREPRRRRKDDESLFEQVMNDVVPGQLVGAKAPHAADANADSRPAMAAAAPPGEPEAAPDAAEDSAPAAAEREREGWPAHRQLIRASLPRIEGEPPTPRPIPEFTMYQRQYGRGGRPFRFGGSGGGNGNGQPGGGERNGNVAHPRGGGDGRSGHGHHGAPPHDGQGQGRPGGGRRHRRRRPR